MLAQKGVRSDRDHRRGQTESTPVARPVGLQGGRAQASALRSGSRLVAQPQVRGFVCEHGRRAAVVRRVKRLVMRFFERNEHEIGDSGL